MLTDKEIKSFTPTGKKKEILDHDRLYLNVYPSGEKTFTFRYTISGKCTKMALGNYKYITLAEARTRAQTYRIQLAEGIDPGVALKAEKLATFETVFCAWHGANHSKVTNHSKMLLSIFENHLIPELGATAIKKVSGIALMAAIQKIQAPMTANRARKYTEVMLKWATIPYDLDKNVATQLKPHFKQPKANNYAAATTESTLRELVNKIWFIKTRCKRHIQLALRMASQLPVRAIDLVSARWDQIDLEARQWRFVDAKMGLDMTMHLSDQMIELLDELRTLTGHFKDAVYLFPHQTKPRTEHMSQSTLLKALRASGVTADQATIHGFRASFRTLMNETGHESYFLEKCLGHSVGPYDRTEHLPERSIIMQAWSDKIYSLLES